ncbi:MAG: OadG family transporter subunit [Candidatus Gastranaerophilaceae bacterium]
MNETLVQGISVMCIGMGTVLTFLCITILSMFVMSNVVQKLNKIFPEPVLQTAGAKVKKSVSDDAEVAAAIVAAMFGRK